MRINAFGQRIIVKGRLIGPWALLTAIALGVLVAAYISPLFWIAPLIAFLYLLLFLMKTRVTARAKRKEIASAQNAVGRIQSESSTGIGRAEKR